MKNAALDMSVLSCMSNKSSKFPHSPAPQKWVKVKEEMGLSERIYRCENPVCGLVIDRDVNAAVNLAALARPSRQPGPYC